MNVVEIAKLTEGKIVIGDKFVDREVEVVFASDLMSDVLTINTNKPLLLVTGLANIQTIRTCEMADIRNVLFVRGKEITEEMKELAEENDMVLIATKFSAFRTSGVLYTSGMKPLY